MLDHVVNGIAKSRRCKYMNVVSLLPSGTEIVAALGRSDSLVAVSHECDHPPEVARLPRVTSSAIDSTADAATVDASVREHLSTGHPLYSVDWDLVASLTPDLIVTQALCDVCAVSETECRSQASLITPAPDIATLSASSLDGVLADIQRVAEALGDPACGMTLTSTLRARIEIIHQRLKAAKAPRPRVAVIEWTEPLFIAGHWTPEMIRRAGGEDCVGTSGAHSTVVTREVILAAQPDIVLVAPCGYDVHRAARVAEEMAWGLETWALDANSLLSRPGPRLIDGVETLAAIFHPALFGAPRPDRALPIT
jgi:iron complex transport system substrate-binding protein